MKAKRGVAASLKETIAAVVVAMLVAACAATTAPRDIVSARKELDAHLAQCTARHGYDPETASSLGPYSLGAGEREWRECVYQGVEKFLIPKSLSPEAYRRAIAEDRQMTASVAGGKMTRAQRGERVQEILKEIDRIEEKNRARLQTTQAADRLGKEEMQRQLDTTRRSMIVPLAR